MGCIADVRNGRVPLRAKLAGGDRRALGRVGGGSRFVTSSALRRRARIGAPVTLATAAVWLVAAAAASAFSAHGSVEQVYVTGLAPSAQMSLLRSNGETVSTQTADSLGGLLFRDVAPGRRYRVRLNSTRRRIGADHRPHASRRAVGSRHLQAVDPGQRLHLPDDARRHPAGDRRPPARHSGGRVWLGSAFQLPASPAASRNDAGSNADRILGIRLREPRGPGKRDRRTG